MQWLVTPNGKRGRQQVFSDAAIQFLGGNTVISVDLLGTGLFIPTIELVGVVATVAALQASSQLVLA